MGNSALVLTDVLGLGDTPLCILPGGADGGWDFLLEGSLSSCPSPLKKSAQQIGLGVWPGEDMVTPGLGSRQSSHACICGLKLSPLLHCLACRCARSERKKEAEMDLRGGSCHGL